MGRPSIYTPEIADEICRRLSEGESLIAICRDDHMPAESTVRMWALTDKEGFYAKYAVSRELQAHKMAEEIIEISNTPEIGTKSVSKATGLEVTEGDMIEHRRLKVDARKWYLSKVLPKVYGDKQQVEHSVSEDTASILMAARKRSGVQKP